MCLARNFFDDAGLAVEAVQRGFGGEADEVAVALFVFGQDQQVVVLVVRPVSRWSSVLQT